MPQLELIGARLDSLAALPPSPFPTISLYLNLQPDGNGRDRFQPFLRKELADRVRTFPAHAPERDSLDQDAVKIAAFLETVEPSANGVAIFACSAAGLFETVELTAPIPEHRLYVSNVPQLYPLARVLDGYPRYAVLLADTNVARLFVVAANSIEKSERVEGTKTRGHKMGGWSQARYQRHIENYHLQHVKEVVQVLGRVVRDDGVESIILAGDEVALPLVKAELPKDLTERVVDIVRLDMRASDRAVLEATLESMRKRDAASDREHVDALLDAYRGNGLGVVGIGATLSALDNGQVDELLIAAATDSIALENGQAGDGPPADCDQMAGELIAKARQTSATVRFIEDAAVAREIGGVGAVLRFRL